MRTIKQRQEYFKKLASKDPQTPYWPSMDRGFQVIITAHNEEEYILDCLESIETAMRNEKWIMHFGDDKSTDKTLSIVNNFKNKSSAQEFNIYDFEKAENVAKAKNRTIQKSIKYSKDFPAILLQDGDDKMAFARAKGLHRFAVDRDNRESSYVYLGDYVYCIYEKNKLDKITAIKAFNKRSWGPWATMIHSSLIPEDGELFYEGVSVHEDLLLWNEIMKAGIGVTSVTGINTCYYNAREGTLSKHEDVKKRKKIWREYKKFLQENDLERELEEKFEDPMLVNPLQSFQFDLPGKYEIEETTGKPKSEEELKRGVERIMEKGTDEFIKELGESS
tara:strand:+ start:328 stop:1329 length:1002 start_codon:yes stop_codon:yes gene_type:complete